MNFDEKNIVKVNHMNYMAAIYLIRSTMEESEVNKAEAETDFRCGDPAWKRFLYKDGDMYVGLVGLYMENKTNGWLSYFAVHPDYQGLGLGRWLMGWIEGKAKEWGVKRIFIETYDTEVYERAVQLYEKLGFSQSGYLDGFYEEKKILYFKKDLQSESISV